MSCFEADKENMSQQSNEDDGLDDFMDDVFSQKIVDVSILLPILPVNTSQSGVTMDFSNVATQQVAPTAPENYVNMSDVATQPSEYNLEFEDIATQKDTDISNRAQDNIPGRYNTTSPYSSQVDNADEDDTPIPTQDSDPRTIWLLNAAKDYIEHVRGNSIDMRVKNEIEDTLGELNWRKGPPNWVEMSHNEKEWWHCISVYYGPWTEWINPWNLILGVDYFWDFRDVMAYVAQNGNKRVKDSIVLPRVNYSNKEKWNISKFFRENIKSQVINETNKYYPLDLVEIENLMLEFGWKCADINGTTIYSKPDSAAITAANIHRYTVDVDYFRDLSSAYTYFRRSFTSIDEDFVHAVTTLATNCSRLREWSNSFGHLKKILKQQQWLFQETDDSHGIVYILSLIHI